MMTKTIRLMILYFISSITVAFFAYVGLWKYHAAVTETALSLCGETLLRSDDLSLKSEMVNDFLAFVRIPEETKKNLQDVIESGDSRIFELADRMVYFTFSQKAVRNLCKEIDTLAEGAIPASQTTSESVKDRAKKLIQDLYGKRVPFQEISGNGTDFLVRYYCSNICIDACSDGSIRYMSDVFGTASADPLRALLFSEADTVVENSETVLSFIFQKLRSKQAYAEVCIDTSTGRIFAAKILFNS